MGTTIALKIKNTQIKIDEVAYRNYTYNMYEYLVGTIMANPL